MHTQCYCYLPYSRKRLREKTFEFFAISESSAKANFVCGYGRTSNPRKF